MEAIIIKNGIVTNRIEIVNTVNNVQLQSGETLELDTAREYSKGDTYPKPA
jgi:hypothetical protein